MSLAICAIAHENDLALAPAARALRNDCMVAPAARKPNCNKEISVNVFFDGTNNNLERDKKAIADPNKRCHTNVVVLCERIS